MTPAERLHDARLRRLAEARRRQAFAEVAISEGGRSYVARDEGYLMLGGLRWLGGLRVVAA